MSAKTKIVVLHMKEIIYTGIFAALGILLAALLVMMFLPGKDGDSPDQSGEDPNAAESGMEGSGDNAGNGASDMDSSGNGASDTDGSGNAGKESGAADGTGAAGRESDGADNADGDAAATLSGNLYIPGIYTTQLVLNDQTVDVEVIVDGESITSLSLGNLSDAVTTMYPLLAPTFEALREQIYEKQSVENITYDTESKYTSLVLLEAIRNSLSKAYAATGSPQGGE